MTMPTTMTFASAVDNDDDDDDLGLGAELMTLFPYRAPHLAGFIGRRGRVEIKGVYNSDRMRSHRAPKKWQCFAQTARASATCVHAEHKRATHISTEFIQMMRRVRWRTQNAKTNIKSRTRLRARLPAPFKSKRRRTTHTRARASTDSSTESL